MRRPIITAAAVLLASAPVAEARPSTLTMTCAIAAATVARAGAIVLTTGELTYDRFVAQSGFCQRGQTTKQAYAPTSDDPNCAIGYVCRENTTINDH